MLERQKVDELILESLMRVEGLVEAKALKDVDRERIIELEQEAEAKSLMGLGKVINAGICQVLESDWVYVALTNMDFDWRGEPNLLLKKGEEVVGEEVTDEQVISELSGRKNVWFMHKNFVVYRDRISFPRDIMEKICHFEIPGHSPDWCDANRDELDFDCIVYGSPSVPGDMFLKNTYFGGTDDKGLGTVLIGVKL
ncbi:MAG: hypothetical protein ACP5SH_10155 [Syntrophobacteraceae bacterium]